MGNRYPIPCYFVTVAGNETSTYVLAFLDDHLRKLAQLTESPPYECKVFPTEESLSIFLRQEVLDEEGRTVAKSDSTVVFFDALSGVKSFSPFHRSQPKKNHPNWTQAAMFSVKIRHLLGNQKRCAQQIAAWFRKGINNKQLEYPWGNASLEERHLGRRVHY